MQKQSLGLWRLTALVSGNMVGSGMFMLPASLAALGSIGLAAWGFSALGAMILALIFASLSKRLPKAGGPYLYCKEAYGDFVGFQVAYHYWVAAWAGNAAIVVGFTSYLAVFFPELNTHPQVALWVSLALLWGLTGINLLGVKEVGILQVIGTVLKIGLLAFVILIGIFHVDMDRLKDFNVSGESSLSAFSRAVMLTLWSFIGLESATVPADHVINPHRNIPRATILGTLISAVVYLLATFVVMGVIPMDQLAHSSAPFADTAESLVGTWGRGLIAFAAIVACFSTLNGWILMQAQMPMAAARDQLFPAVFGQLSKREVPAFGLILSSSLVTILLVIHQAGNLVEEFTFVISLATVATLIPYFYTAMADWLLGIRGGKNAKGMMILGILGAFYTCWALYGSGKDLIFDLFFLLLSSVPVYAWVKKRHHRVV